MRPTVRYIMRATKKGLEKVSKSLQGSKAKLSPSKLFVMFKCQIQSEITKKFAKKCIDTSSL